jgi:hypothetical protein
MGFLDALLGRDKPVKSKTEALFALTTAQTTMQVELELTPTNRAAISFRPVSTGEWGTMEKEVKDLLEISTKDAPLSWSWFSDDYGFKWVILQADEFENLVATVNMISEELTAHGFGDQLLAAIFQFVDAEKRHVYLIYNYKRGTFYPFIPNPNKKQERMNALEFRISGVMQKELPIEKEVEAWYPLWGVPL